MLPSRHTSECEDLLKRCWLAPPMLCDYLPTRLPSQVTKEERGNDGIVERTNDRDELRNQVDGRSKPRQSEDEKELGVRGTRSSRRSPRKTRRRLGINTASSRAADFRPARATIRMSSSQRVTAAAAVMMRMRIPSYCSSWPATARGMPKQVMGLG